VGDSKERSKVRKSREGEVLKAKTVIGEAVDVVGHNPEKGKGGGGRI